MRSVSAMKHKFKIGDLVRDKNFEDSLGIILRLLDEMEYGPNYGPGYEIWWLSHKKNLTGSEQVLRKVP